MKNRVIFLIAFVLLLLSVTSCGESAGKNENSGLSNGLPANTESRFHQTGTPENSAASRTDENEERKVVNFTEMKGIWVSQFDMESVYCSGMAQRNKAGYISLTKRIVTDIKNLGFNTVVLQIRPYGDSMYQSAFYPVSRFVAGEYGGVLAYDPVEIFVSAAKGAGLSVHAWINPMRLMTKAEMADVPDGNLLKKWDGEGLLPEVGGRLYLDVSRDDARNLIINGAVEALTKYPFDGLHMDDYFYPTSDPSFDHASFSKSPYQSLSEFRKQSLNKLVGALYAAVKAVNPRLLFGISPAGNLKTVVSTYYADVYEWCGNPHYLDYILPQVYFGLDHGSCPFEQTVKDWAGIVTNGSTRLYVGMSLGKAVGGSRGEIDPYAVTEEGKNEWIRHKDVLKRCLEFLKGYQDTDGYCFFCYQYFYDPLSGNPNVHSKDEVEAFLPLLADSPVT